MEGGGGIRRMISIDRWSEESQAYFLTHLHADHTEGLSSSWSRGPLFCSAISARLLPSKFPTFDLSLVTVLHVGKTYSIPLVSSTTGRRISVHVTPIDAHHCPGAVMYLFKGEFGCILHTGDFRWEPSSERACRGRKALLEALSGDRVDLLFLDNTYCHPSFSFPSRDDAAQQVIDVINLHPNHDIVIGIDKLGKEELLLHIAHTLNLKIWVWPERLHTMHILGLDDIFTTKTSLTRIRAVPRYSLTVATLAALNEIRPTIGIMPSGLAWEVKSFNQYDAALASSFTPYTGSKKVADVMPPTNMNHLGNIKSHNKHIHTVPYSDHSCFNEIKDLVELVEPVNITGIVSSSICYTNPCQYFNPSLGQLPDPLEYVKGSQSRRRTITHVEPKKRRKRSKEQNDATQKASIAANVVHRSRVNLMRRDRRGVKLLETELDSGSHRGIT